MFADLGKVVLKNGEEVQAGVVAGPDTEWAERVEALLKHKGDPWNWQNARVLRDDVGIDARFFLLHRDGQPFANIMTAERRGVGILGHVWTRPEDRKQGAASALMGLSLSDFRTRHGRALFLGTGFDSPAYHLYSKHGFTALEDRSGAMAYHSESKEQFDDSYFKKGPTSIEP
jgi:GNAT superfamily N-acetyltransferase